MSDKGWKQFERRAARDMGTQRIPVTGERHGADCATGLFCFQFKLRRSLPGWLWDWLGGIVGAAQPSGRIGVLVLKKPRQRDAEALVVLRWCDWVELHGGTSDESRAGSGAAGQREAQSGAAHQAGAEAHRAAPDDGRSGRDDRMHLGRGSVAEGRASAVSKL